MYYMLQYYNIICTIYTHETRRYGYGFGRVRGFWTPTRTRPHLWQDYHSVTPHIGLCGISWESAREYSGWRDWEGRKETQESLVAGLTDGKSFLAPTASLPWMLCMLIISSRTESITALNAMHIDHFFLHQKPHSPECYVYLPWMLYMATIVLRLWKAPCIFSIVLIFRTPLFSICGNTPCTFSIVLLK